MGRRPDLSGVADVPGLGESGVHGLSGLRSCGFSGLMTEDYNWVLGSGVHTAVAVTEWTDLGALANSRLPSPQTLVFSLAGTTADIQVDGTYQLRVTGFDQFGQKIQEVTPVMTTIATTAGSNTRMVFYLSQVFAYVTKIEYRNPNPIGSPGDYEYEVGISNEWVYSNAGTDIKHAYGNNHGIGIPLRINLHAADNIGAYADMDLMSLVVARNHGTEQIGVPTNAQIVLGRNDTSILSEAANTADAPWGGGPEKFALITPANIPIPGGTTWTTWTVTDKIEFHAIAHTTRGMFQQSTTTPTYPR